MNRIPPPNEYQQPQNKIARKTLGEETLLLKKNTAKPKPKVIQPPIPMDLKVYGFLDHTNINIMTQKAAGREYHFPDGIDDTCARVVPSKVFDFLKGHHMKPENGRGDLEHLYCYTSDSTVAGYDNIGGRNIKPRVFRSSGWSKREKIVDTYMVADAIETMFLKKSSSIAEINLNSNPQPVGIISLWTGDNDILCPVIDKALDHNWKVEIWSFKGSISPEIVGKYPTVPIRELDSIFKDIRERKTGWKSIADKVPPKNGSFKLQFEPESRELELAKEHWKEIVECLTRRVDIPLQAWCQWQEATMFLILAVPGRDLHNYMKVIWDRKEGLECEVHTYMRNHFRVDSTCRVVIEGSYPQESENMVRPAGGSQHVAGYRGRVSAFDNTYQPRRGDGRGRHPGRVGYQNPRGGRGAQGRGSHPGSRSQGSSHFLQNDGSEF